MAEEIRSQNGWTCPGRSVIATYTVPGTTLRIPLRKGDVSVILLDFLARYHREVESLYHNPQDLWGYADRTVRGSSTTVSNHASGTAADHRAVDHPLGKRGTFTAAEVHALNRILAFYEGVLRHGKDYTGRADEMHVEINAGAAAVKRVADKVRSGAQPTIPAVPLKGEFLMALSDAEQRELLDNLRDLRRWLSPVEFVPPGGDPAKPWAVTAGQAAANVYVATFFGGPSTEGRSLFQAIAEAAADTGHTALSDADVQRIAKAVIAGLPRGTGPAAPGLAQVYEFTGTATPKPSA